MAYTDLVVFSGSERSGDVVTQKLSATAGTGFAPVTVEEGELWFGTWPFLTGNRVWAHNYSNTTNLYIAADDRGLNGSVYSEDFASIRYLALRYSLDGRSYDGNPKFYIIKATTPGTGDLANAYAVSGVKITDGSGTAQFHFEGETRNRVQWARVSQDIYDDARIWDSSRPFGDPVPSLSAFCEIVNVPSMLVAGSVSLVTGNANLAVIRTRYNEAIEDYTFATLQDIRYLIQSITTQDRRTMEIVLVVNP